MMINLDEFKRELKEATKIAFIDCVENNSIYAFALYSDENCETISTVANTETFLKKTREEYDDPACMVCQFSPSEWDFEITNMNKKLQKLQKKLQEEFLSDKSEAEFKMFRKKFYSLCIEVLAELNEEGFFIENYSKDIFLIFEASEFEFEDSDTESMIKALNSAKYTNEYINWMNTWGE